MCLNVYNVTLENSDGKLYNHSCMVTSKREAAVSAMMYVDSCDKLKESDYVIISCDCRADNYNTLEYEKEDEE